MRCRHLLHLSVLAAGLAAAGVLSLAQPAAAQEPRVISMGGGTVSTAAIANLPVSDDVVRKLIEVNLPEALLDDGTAARHVLLVLDANDQYVSGRVTKATVITSESEAGSGNRTFVVGDTTGGAAHAGAVMIRRESNGTNVTSPTGSGVAVFSRVGGDGDAVHGVMGSGYDLSQVGSIGMKRFAAGTMSSSTLMVSVVKLK